MIIQDNWCLAEDRRLIIMEIYTFEAVMDSNLIQEKHYSKNENYME